MYMDQARVQGGGGPMGPGPPPLRFEKQKQGHAPRDLNYLLVYRA